MLEIDRMTFEDCAQVYLLLEKCFTVPWSYQDIKDMFVRPGYYNLVARKEKKLVGYIGILAVLDEADITNVAVDPGFRRMHIGTALLNGLLALAREEKIEHIFLEVRQSNQAAIRLYENAGFSAVDIRKNYYEQPQEDAVILKR